ncbi:MAG: PAS domain S-box protein [Rhodospirillales bacterium]|nr:PAS domain S-box protein [Rhodospirillales bacterium]
MAATPTFRSTIRRLIAPVALSTAIGIAVIGAILVFAAQELDRVSRVDSAHLLQTAIRLSRENTEKIALDYSYWDQAVDNIVKDFDQNWADANIGTYLSETYGICSAYVLNPENRVVYSIANCATKTSDPFIRFKGGLKQLVDEARKSPRNEQPVPAEGLLWDGEHAHSVAASVLTDYELIDGKEVLESTDWVLIVTNGFHDEAVVEIGSKFLLKNLQIVAGEYTGKLVHLPLTLADGQQAANFVWYPPEPGWKMLWRTVPVVLAVLIILGGLTVLFVRRASETARLLEEQTAAVIEEKARAAEYLNVAEIILIALDNQGDITLINRKGCEVLGYSEDELIGKNWFEHVIPADEKAEIEAAFRKVFREETEPILHRENHVTTKSGERRLISWQNSFVRGPDGEVTASLSSGQDITEIRRGEEALQEQRALLQAVLENSSVEIYVKDVEGRFLLVNERFAADNGMTPEEVIGKTSHDLVPKKSAELFDAQDRSVIEKNSTTTFEIPVLRPDGSEQIYFVTKFPIPGEDGNIIGTGGISTEITEHARAEIAAKRLQEDLANILRVGTVGEMATGIAHEVNQPLAAIKNYAAGMLRRLRSGSAEPEDMTRILEIIAEQAQRAGDIIRNIRRLAHRETGEVENIDVNTAVREVASVLTNEAVAKDIRIELDLEGNLDRPSGEAVQIQQAILNLARNAMEAMAATEPDRTARRLTIRTAPAERDAIQISVVDRGTGIPEKLRSQIFNPFFTTRTSGLGMGLPICRTIIEGHGGEIWFTSDPGEGTAFHFTLPVETYAVEPRRAASYKENE